MAKKKKEENEEENNEDAESTAEDKNEKTNDDSSADEDAEQDDADVDSEELEDLSEDLQEMITKIEEMSVIELNTLVKALEKKFGVTAQAPVAAAAAGGGNGAEAEEEKSAYDVVLADMGDNKLAVIKAVRSVDQNLGLKEAKELVESAPKPVAEAVAKDEAEEMKEKLEEAGANVELK